MKVPLLFNAIDGVFRVAIFVLFLLIISRMKDMNRVFEYHGAEHKTVYNFEARENADSRECPEVFHASSAMRNELSAGRDDRQHHRVLGGSL